MSAVPAWLNEGRDEGRSLSDRPWPVLASGEESGWYALTDWTGHRPSGIAHDLYTKIVLKAGDPIKPGDLEHVPANVRTQDEGKARAAKPREAIQGDSRMIGSHLRAV